MLLGLSKNGALGIFAIFLYFSFFLGNYIQGNGDMQLVVAVAPERVAMRVDNVEDSQESLVVKFEEGTESKLDVECIAYQSRPKPEFRWFIGQTPINANTEVIEENNNDGKVDYISRLSYYANVKHNNQELRCVVEHMAYTEVQKAEEFNVAKKVLELFCKLTLNPSNYYLIFATTWGIINFLGTCETFIVTPAKITGFGRYKMINIWPQIWPCQWRLSQ